MIHAAMPPPDREGEYRYLRHPKLNIAVQNDGRDLVHVDHAVEHQGDVTVGVSYRKHMVGNILVHNHVLRAVLEGNLHPSNAPFWIVLHFSGIHADGNGRNLDIPVRQRQIAHFSQRFFGDRDLLRAVKPPIQPLVHKSLISGIHDFLTGSPRRHFLVFVAQRLLQMLYCLVLAELLLDLLLGLLPFITTVAGVYLFLAVAGFRTGIVTNFIVFVPYLLTIVYLFIAELYTGNKDAINDWAYTMLSQMYIALPFSMINVLAFETSTFDGQIHYDMLLPLSIFIFLWTNDTGAYCSGSLFGKHKLFPRISPAKSWEGSIGGGIFVIIAAIIIGYLANDGAAHRLSIPGWVGLGLVVTFFGTWGDLVESLFKRTLGVKDSGTILPGHGGMLDRFDSSLMAIPAAVIYLYTLQLFG